MTDANFSHAETERLASYWAGEMSPDEQRAVEAWLRETPEREYLANQGREMWDRVASQQRQARGNAQLFAGRLVDHIRRDRPQSQSPESLRPTKWRRFATMIGSGCAAIVALWGVVHVLSPSGQTQGAVRETIYTTSSGERSAVVLAGGVVVTMAPETKLHHTLSQDGASLVDLEGEAYFEVAHATNRAFTVTTSNTQTRVLGTAFTVRAYPTDSATEVAVFEGKVSTGSARTRTILTQDMLARIGDSTIITKNSTGTSAAWMNGELVFQETPVPTMLKTAGRWFGYEFQLADSALAKRHVTTVLLADRPEEAMTLIASVLNVRITLDGRVATLHPRRAISRTGPSAPAKTNRQIDSTIIRGVGK